MIQKLPIVGGIFHGGECACHGAEMERPYLPSHMPQTWTADGPALAFECERYRREKFCIQRGALRLQGEAWVHKDLSAEDAVSMAIGLLIDGALRTRR